MWDWLSKLDPNALVGSLTVIGSVGAWLYHQIRGDKHDNFENVAIGAVNTAVHLVVDQLASRGMTLEQLADAARSQLDDYAWRALSRLGVQHSAVVDALVRSVVEHGVQDVIAGVKERLVKATIPEQLDSIAKTAQSVVDAIKKAPDLTQGFELTATMQPDGSFKRDP